MWRRVERRRDLVKSKWGGGHANHVALVSCLQISQLPDMSSCLKHLLLSRSCHCNWAREIFDKLLELYMIFWWSLGCL